MLTARCSNHEKYHKHSKQNLRSIFGSTIVCFRSKTHNTITDCINVSVAQKRALERQNAITKQVSECVFLNFERNQKMIKVQAKMTPEVRGVLPGSDLLDTREIITSFLTLPSGGINIFIVDMRESHVG